MKVEPARATGDHGAGPQGRGVMSTLDTPRRSERSARSGTGAPSRVRAGFRVQAARGHRQRALRLAAARARLGARNGRLLGGGRAAAGRLRFAVSYADAGGHAAAAGKSGKKGRQKGRGASANAARRPTLAYDFEDPRVFRAFEQTMMSLPRVPHAGTAGDAAGGGGAGGDDDLSSALAANCRVHSR